MDSFETTRAGSENNFRLPSLASVIIPTFNGGQRIGSCLDALFQQTSADEVTATQIEVLVVDDGSTDNTADLVARYFSPSFPKVRLIRQANAGPAAARNRGAAEARGTIILFTDDDCVPTRDWLETMLSPFEDAQVVGVKGAYRTRQCSMIARFVQIEYEDRYRIMAGHDGIDFIDTYSAAFRREPFLEMRGYDTSFPVACAEDIELSYRMSARGWKMKFEPAAIVYHTHPDTLRGYLRKKYKFSFWRVLAVRKNPSKAWKDSHTPQLMKLHLLLMPALLVALLVDVSLRPYLSASLLVLIMFWTSVFPFVLRAARKDLLVAILLPLLLAARSVAQLVGVCAGLINAVGAHAKASAMPSPEHPGQ